MKIKINWLRRLICDCDCQKSQHKKRSKYAPERDIDTVQTGGYMPKGSEPKPINPPRRPLPPGKE